MIVVLCDDFQQANDAFDVFVQWLQDEHPWNIKNVNIHALRVETDDDLIYTFIDCRYARSLEKYWQDMIDVDLFFEGIEEWEGAY